MGLQWVATGGSGAEKWGGAGTRSGREKIEKCGERLYGKGC